MLSEGDLLWAGLTSDAQQSYRRLMRLLSERHFDGGRALTMAFNIPEWDAGQELPKEYLAEADETGLDEWLAHLHELQHDIEIVWKLRNVQGLGVALRAQAEHLGLGTLRFGCTYAADGLPSLVSGPIGEQRLRWARRRVRWLLSNLTQDPYDGLTVLAGFAHPSRFSMQVYLNRSLGQTGTVRVSAAGGGLDPSYFGVVTQRLLSLAAPLASLARAHVT